jgi:hypothetical protein
MNTSLAPGQITPKPAAEAIALKHCLAVLTADSVIIPYSFVMVAKHMDEKIANWPAFSGGLRVGNADNVDSSSDSSLKANRSAFYDRGMRIAGQEVWYCS